MKSPRRPRLALTGILSFLILLAAVTPASSAHTNYATYKPTRAAAYLSSTPQSYISGGTVGSHAWGLGDLYIQIFSPAWPAQRRAWSTSGTEGYRTT
jgi:hypothetical protein